MKIWTEYTFSAAHFLPNVSDGHKCGNMHGHTYRVRVVLDSVFDTDVVNNPAGWVVDFAEIHKVVKPLIADLDHTVLNDMVGLDNPTSENLSIWIYKNCIKQLPLLASVEVSENQTSGVIYEG